MTTLMARKNAMRPVRRLILCLLLIPLFLFIFYRSKSSTPGTIPTLYDRSFTVHINGRWQDTRRLYGLPILPAVVSFPLSRSVSYFTPKKPLLRAARFDLRRKRSLEEYRPPPLHIGNAQLPPQMLRRIEDFAAELRSRARTEQDPTAHEPGM